MCYDMIINQKERRNRVIETIVQAFMETGKPLSSAFVSAKCGLGLKPASIRSFMKELEDEGYLAQPHTSAGRVPTVKCYRYYVGHLMPEINLCDEDLQAFRKVIEEGMKEHDAVIFMNHMASVLSEVTDLIGVALSPSFEQGIFDRIEIVKLGGSGYLLILSLKSGFVNTIRITLDSVIPRWKIEETARLLTDRLHGLTIFEIKASIGRCLKNVSGGDRKLVEVILAKSDSIFSFSEERNIHVAGLSRVLAHPDFEPFDYSRKFVCMCEHKNEIAKALSLTELEENDVSIHIGGREPWGSHPPLCLVSATYRSGTMAGAFGIIGPARVYYPKLSALVRYAASFTSHYFS